MLQAKSNGYGAADVCKRVGISPRQLEYWVLIGAVRPVCERHGSKLFKRYSDNDLWILKSIKDLTDEGYLVSRAVERLKRLFPERFERSLA